MIATVIGALETIPTRHTAYHAEEGPEDKHPRKGSHTEKNLLLEEQT